MSKKRRQFTDKFKAKVALEAVRGMKTLAYESGFGLEKAFNIESIGAVCSE